MTSSTQYLPLNIIPWKNGLIKAELLLLMADLF